VYNLSWLTAVYKRTHKMLTTEGDPLTLNAHNTIIEVQSPSNVRYAHVTNQICDCALMAPLCEQYTILSGLVSSPRFTINVLFLGLHQASRFPICIQKLFLTFYKWNTQWHSGWGTALQTGRSPNRFPMVSLTPSCAECLKIWEPQPSGTLRTCQGL
jgi:hypothetical protein